MKGRIRELAFTAGCKFKKFNKGAAMYQNVENDLQKFAELIVQECIAQCEKNKDHEWLGSGSKLSAFNIREHFGVEE